MLILCLSYFITTVNCQIVRFVIYCAACGTERLFSLVLNKSSIPCNSFTKTTCLKPKILPDKSATLKTKTTATGVKKFLVHALLVTDSTAKKREGKFKT